MKFVNKNVSLSEKINQIKLLIEVLKPHLLCVYQSWLNCHISDISVELSYCHLLKKDKSDGRIGIAFYIRKNRNYEYKNMRSNNELYLRVEN